MKFSMFSTIYADLYWIYTGLTNSFRILAYVLNHGLSYPKLYLIYENKHTHCVTFDNGISNVSPIQRIQTR